MHKLFKLSFVDNRTIERIYEVKRKGRVIFDFDIYGNDSEDDEVLPLNDSDFEERLGKGFRILDMTKNGYPSDC